MPHRFGNPGLTAFLAPAWRAGPANPGISGSCRHEVEFPRDQWLFVRSEDPFDELHVHGEKPLEGLREADLEHSIAWEILGRELRGRGVGLAARLDFGLV